MAKVFQHIIKDRNFGPIRAVPLPFSERIQLGRDLRKPDLTKVETNGRNFFKKIRGPNTNVIEFEGLGNRPDKSPRIFVE